MANTIYPTVGIYSSDGTTYLNQQPSLTQVITQTGTHSYVNSLDIPTTAAGTALTLGANLGTVGWSFFRNLDSANYIEIGVNVAATFYPVIKLKAGEYCVTRISVAAPYARANTATVTLYYSILEN